MGENADHKTLGSQVLKPGEIAAKSQKFAGEKVPAYAT